ncbi:hypothetical protein QJQ45_026195, partial [Haematococcus lacustris]
EQHAAVLLAAEERLAVAEQAHATEVEKLHAQYRAEVAQVQTQLGQAKERALQDQGRLEQQLAQALASYAQAATQRDTLQSAAAAARSEADLLRSQRQADQDSLRDLTRVLHQRQASVERLQQQLEVSQAAVTEAAAMWVTGPGLPLRPGHHTLRCLIWACNRTAEAMRVKARQAGRYETACTAKDQALAQAESAASTASALKAELGALQQQWLPSQGAMRDVEAELGTLQLSSRDALQALQAESRTAQAAQAQAAAAVTALEHDKERLQKLLAAAGDELAALTAQLHSRQDTSKAVEVELAKWMSHEQAEGVSEEQQAAAQSAVVGLTEARMHTQLRLLQAAAAADSARAVHQSTQELRQQLGSSLARVAALEEREAQLEEEVEQLKMALGGPWAMGGRESGWGPRPPPTTRPPPTAASDITAPSVMASHPLDPAATVSPPQTAQQERQQEGQQEGQQQQQQRGQPGWGLQPGRGLRAAWASLWPGARRRSPSPPLLTLHTDTLPPATAQEATDSPGVPRPAQHMAQESGTPPSSPQPQPLPAPVTLTADINEPLAAGGGGRAGEQLGSPLPPGEQLGSLAVANNIVPHSHSHSHSHSHTAVTRKATAGVARGNRFVAVSSATLPHTSAPSPSAAAVFAWLEMMSCPSLLLPVTPQHQQLILQQQEQAQKEMVEVPVPEDPDSDIEDRDEALQPDLTEAERNRKVSGEARAARDRDNTYHGRKCKLAHLIDHLPQELWDAFRADAVQPRVEAISERAVLASLLWAYSLLAAIPRHPSDTNIVDHVGKQLETAFSNMLTLLFAGRLKKSVSLAGAKVLVGTNEHQRRFGFRGPGGGHLPAWSKRQCTYVRRMVCGLDVSWLLEEGGVVPTAAMQAEVALQRGLLEHHHTTREMEAAMAAWQLDMVPWQQAELISHGLLPRPPRPPTPYALTPTSKCPAGALAVQGLHTRKHDAASTSKLEEFLTTLVTYPYLYLAATSPLPGTGTKLNGPVAVSSDARLRLTDFPEGRAIVALEKWCAEPIAASKGTELAIKAREHLKGLAAWAATPPSDPSSAEQLDLPPQASQLQPWLVKALGLMLQGLDAVVGPAPPELSVAEVTTLQRSLLVSGASASPPHAAGLPLPAISLLPPATGNSGQEPLKAVVAAVAPNMHFLQQQLERKYELSRGRTWFEFLNVLLGYVRFWLTGLAYIFYLAATALRLVGNGLSAVGGLVAFTVVLSVAASVLSALTFLSASACDATGTFIEYMARFTDLAQRNTRSTRAASMQGTLSKLGPGRLGPASFEDLEEFFMRQLTQLPHAAPPPSPGSPQRRPPLTPPDPSGAQQQRGKQRGGGAGRQQRRLRAESGSRPDVPRLAHDPLLVRCYDLQAGAVLLLRLLAWRRIASIMACPGQSGPGPSAASADSEEPLRYVWLTGLRGAGASTLYRALAALPRDYKVAASSSMAEIRPLHRHRFAYAVLPPRPASPGAEGGPGAPATASRSAAVKASAWLTDLSHGVVSCLICVISVDTSLESVLPGSAGFGGDGVAGDATPAVTADVRGVDGYGAGAKDVGSAAAAAALAPVWQALALRKPVLVALNKAFKVHDKLAAQPGRASDLLVNKWRLAFGEEANRRGLDPDSLTVTLTELLDTPPPGVAGLPQLSDWLAASLAVAPQQR